MKKNFLWILFALAAACNGVTNTKKETPDMPGVYQMLSQTVQGDNTDTTLVHLRQLKIFTPDYMMYANVNPEDSVSAFGIGSYTADTGLITENIIYSAADSTITTSFKPFNLQIEKTEKGYKQIIDAIRSQGKLYKLTEAYQAVGTNETSPLDGAWEQTKYFYIKGNDTSLSGPKQFKAYYKGHFIWGNTSTAVSGKRSTYIGFGTFTMEGKNKLKETIITSTNSSFTGRVFNIDIVMDENDAFTQTITNADSTKTVEFYIRLKK